MSHISPSLEDVDLLLNGGVPLNNLNYIRKQAISADHVLFTLAIRNRLLIRWSRFLQDGTNTVDLLNLMIPNGALKIDRTSERMKSVVERQSSARKNPSECSVLLVLAAMLNFSFRDDVRVLIQWRARISLV